MARALRISLGAFLLAVALNFLVDFSEGAQRHFDYLMLTLSWQGNFCHYKSCVSDCRLEGAAARWGRRPTIHGLWPQYSQNYGGAMWPETCTNKQFDPSAMSRMKHDFKTVMDAFPNIKVSGGMAASSFDDLSSGYFQFWEHEFTKHGTCTDFKTQEEYFDAAIELWLGLPELPSFTANIGGKVPLKTLQAEAGPEVEFTCKGNKIVEVRYCLDANLQKINCKANGYQASNACRAGSTITIEDLATCHSGGPGPDPGTVPVDGDRITELTVENTSPDGAILKAGDLAFVYFSSASKEMSLITLVDLPKGTVFAMTDTYSGGGYGGSEGFVVYEVEVALTAGTIIDWSLNDAVPGWSRGQLSGGSNFDPSGKDTIVAYQGDPSKSIVAFLTKPGDAPPGFFPQNLVVNLQGLGKTAGFDFSVVASAESITQSDFVNLLTNDENWANGYEAPVKLPKIISSGVIIPTGTPTKSSSLSTAIGTPDDKKTSSGVATDSIVVVSELTTTSDARPADDIFTVDYSGGTMITAGHAVVMQYFANEEDPSNSILTLLMLKKIRRGTVFGLTDAWAPYRDLDRSKGIAVFTAIKDIDAGQTIEFRPSVVTADSGYWEILGNFHIDPEDVIVVFQGQAMSGRHVFALQKGDSPDLDIPEDLAFGYTAVLLDRFLPGDRVGFPFANLGRQPSYTTAHVLGAMCDQRRWRVLGKDLDVFPKPESIVIVDLANKTDGDAIVTYEEIVETRIVYRKAGALNVQPAHLTTLVFAWVGFILVH